MSMTVKYLGEDAKWKRREVVNAGGRNMRGRDEKKKGR
jgi:hypothetical protein